MSARKLSKGEIDDFFRSAVKQLIRLRHPNRPPRPKRMRQRKVRPH